MILQAYGIYFINSRIFSSLKSRVITPYLHNGRHFTVYWDMLLVMIYMMVDISSSFNFWWNEWHNLICISADIYFSLTPYLVIMHNFLWLKKYIITMILGIFTHFSFVILILLKLRLRFVNVLDCHELKFLSTLYVFINQFWSVVQVSIIRNVWTTITSVGKSRNRRNEEITIVHL